MVNDGLVQDFPQNTTHSILATNNLFPISHHPPFTTHGFSNITSLLFNMVPECPLLASEAGLTPNRLCVTCSREISHPSAAHSRHRHCQPHIFCFSWMGNGGRPGFSAGMLFICAARCSIYVSSGLSLLLQLGSMENGSGPLEGWAIHRQDKNLAQKTL